MLTFALRNLLSRPARSLLSLLGLTVAIVGMVGLFSVAEGIDQTVDQTFNRIPGLVCMQRGAPIPLFSRIPLAWRDEIEVLPGVNVVSAEIWIRVNVVNGKTIVAPPRFLFGADLDAHAKLKYSVYGSAMVEGRYLNLTDKGSQHCVVSRQIAEEFKLEVGDSFVVNEMPLKVIGIYHCGSLLLDVAILVDQGLVRRMSMFDSRAVCSFYVEPTGEIPNDQLAESIRAVFRGRSHVAWQPSSLLFSAMGSVGSTRSAPVEGETDNPLVNMIRRTDAAIKSTRPKTAAQPSDEPPAPGSTAQKVAHQKATNADDEEETSPLEIRSSSDWAERFDEFSSGLDIFLGIMTSIGLTIAVLSIINTMLMSVTERIIEFGILKANGWSRSDVMKLITYESAVLGFGGGFLGSFLGWILTLVVNQIWPEHVHLLASPSLLLFSLIFATLLGMAGGLYPALWATRMMPMEAIRRG